MINEYLTLRTNLVCTFVLIDVRHEPQKVDVEFMQKLGENGLPFCIVFTKSDKLSNTAVNKNLAIYEQIMLETWEEMPQYFVTSSVNGTGREEILAYIDELNQGFKP
jgi:GTP-binding protein